MMSTYRKAGVDLEAAERVVDLIGDAVTSTWGPQVVGGFGGFAGGFRIPPEYEDPVLMMSTDGIGTKLDLARSVGRLDGVGFDLVAMVADDLAAAGAQPLALTDYIAVGSLDPDEVATIVSSIARACQAAGVALVGGETAEHPGVLPPESLDVSAAAVGVAEGAALFDPDRVQPGDVLVGVASPNLRSNGFSLVRAVIEGRASAAATLDPEDPLIASVLEPSILYTPAAVAVRHLVKGFSHITGGGIPGNLQRMLPERVHAEVDESAWTEPAVFQSLATSGAIDRREMRRVFNMGIGFAAVCDPQEVEGVRSGFEAHGHETFVIGQVRPGAGEVVYSNRGG